MAKQTEFESPPKGHVGLLVYDSGTNKWYAVLGDSGGHIQLDVVAVALPDGAATALKQLADGHNVTVDNVSIAVTGAFYQVTQPISEATPSVRDVQLYAWDGDSWEKVTIDASGHLQIDVAAAAALNVQQHQYDGSAWRKSNLLFGYNDSYLGYEYENNVAEGDRTLTFSTVPANEVWVITSMGAWAVQTNPDYALFAVYDGTDTAPIGIKPITAATLSVSPSLPLIVPPNGYLYVTFGGCSAGDDIRAGACGYKMRLDL